MPEQDSTQQAKPITASQQKMLLKVIDEDYTNLKNNVGRAAKDWFDQAMRDLCAEIGDNEETLARGRKLVEEARRQAELLFEEAYTECKKLGLAPSNGGEPSFSARYTTGWSNERFVRRSQELRQQLLNATERGFQAVHEAHLEARRKVLLAGLKGTDALHLLEAVPTMHELLGRYFTSEPAQIEA